MTIILGSARWGESGGYNQKKGDQSGREVDTESYYTHEYGWYIIRAKDAQIAAWLAEGMLIACNNDHIGYDMNDRYGVVKSGIRTTYDVNSDCSSLVRTVVEWATGYDPGDFTTANEKSKLLATGYFDDKGECNSSSQASSKLCNGDILVSQKQGHTVIVVSGATKRPIPPKTRDQCTQHRSNLTAAQRWDLIKDGDYYKIVNRNNKECLDLQGGKSKPMANGRVIHTYEDNGADAQRWKLVPHGSIENAYYIASKINENYVLEVTGGAWDKDAYIQLHKKQTEKVNQWAQVWYKVKNFNGGYSFVNAKSLYVLDSNPKHYIL